MYSSRNKHENGPHMRLFAPDLSRGFVKYSWTDSLRRVDGSPPPTVMMIVVVMVMVGTTLRRSRRIIL